MLYIYELSNTYHLEAEIFSADNALILACT